MTIFRVQHKIHSSAIFVKIHLVSYILILINVLLLINGCSGEKITQKPEMYQDAFSLNSGWHLSEDASAKVTIENGVLEIVVHEPGQVAWSSHESRWQNFELEVTTEQISGPVDNEYGVLVRMDNDTSFYVFSISGDGYARAALFQDNGWIVLGPDWTPHTAINQGSSTNVLKVIAQDTLMSFSVNDIKVLSVEDTSLQKGNIGLYAGAFTEGGVAITFDNLSVTGLP